MDSRGMIHYLEEEEARKRKDLVSIPERLEQAAKDAHDRGISLAQSDNKEAAKWARRKIKRLKSRKRKAIAKVSKKKNRKK